MCRDWVISPIASTVGRITPSTRRPLPKRQRSFCCMVLRAFADAVLQARMTSWHPRLNSASTAWSV